MDKRTNLYKWKITSLLLTLLFFASVLETKAEQTARATGVVYEMIDGKRVPLDFATVSFPDFGLGTTTNNGGRYTFTNVPVGKVRMRVSCLGKVQIDTLVTVNSDFRQDFTMLDDNFRLKEVTVTATSSAAGQATSSNISHQATEHLQATSLADLMALLPGGISRNPDLNSAKTLNIRQIYNGKTNDINSLGTSIIQDGAPISNNANLSTGNPTVTGGAGSLAGGSSPNSGFDTRTISTENIENVEVVRGIPSVEYGDLTSGAVIIHSKAGREPLRIKAKANPNVYQGSMGYGFGLGNKSGTLNLSLDYAYNVKDPMSSYNHYQRFTAKALYSNTFFGNKLRSNTSLDFSYGKDERDRNPDDVTLMLNSRGEDTGLRFNSNGTLNINKGWLENIRYVISASYTAKNSYYEQAYSSANAPYSMTTTDGAVLSNTAGEHLYAADGTEITHFGSADASNYAVYLPSSYVGRYDIDSKEVNVYAKLTSNFFKHFGHVNNRILFGVDFKTDGNEGAGKTYDPARPPLRSQSQKNATFRPRAYKDIPYINQFGAFLEERFCWMVGGTHAFNLQGGLRFDNVSVAGNTLSPRFNVSFDVIPETFTIRGGFGITAKMPTLLYLYPENAYFEYINLNELANENIPEANRKFVTTTRVFDTQNKDLRIAKNYKSEVGFDLNFGKVSLNVIGFVEKLKDGYSLNYTFNSFKAVTYNKYARNVSGDIELSGSYPVLSSFYTPTNSIFVTTKGVEFDLNIARIEAIRTAFQLSGSWMRCDSYSDAYYFYDNSSEEPSTRTNIAIYDKHRLDNHEQQFTTSLRATHNIPRLGLAVTLTAQAIWQQSNWTTYNNDSIPLGYLSLQDAKTTWFTSGQYTTTAELAAAGYSHLLYNIDHTNAIKESYRPYFCFNINITKEISDLLRMSFFANNMFRSYPRRESKRSPGTYYSMNNRFYFGMELSMKI